MKKLILCSIFLFTSLGINAQIIELEDLMDFVEYYYADEIIDILKDNGYTYYDTNRSGKGYVQYVYHAERQDSYRMLKVNKDLNDKDDDVHSLEYYTFSYQEYETFFSDISYMGFKRIDKGLDSNIRVYERRKHIYDEYDEYYDYDISFVVTIGQQYYSQLKSYAYIVNIELIYFY